jgi:hypothetical protein
MFSLKLDYKSLKTELCDIGAKYDTDCSSQRANVTNDRHCHPYTIFYDSLFKNYRTSDISLAEIGVGGSTKMWREYFTSASMYGFDSDASHATENVTMTVLDVKSSVSIQEAFATVNQQYDCIIEDTTHILKDQCRVVLETWKYLKPGGILILQSIYKHYDENEYTNRLSDIANEFQDSYFVSFQHERQCSTGWDNDKILVLVKKGDGTSSQIFKQRNKVTLITPSIRPQNLMKIKDSINFDYINEWIIVYDGSKIKENPKVFAEENNPKIKEYLHEGDGISGNPQRNYALDHIEIADTYLYFLDDDNTIDPDLYRLLNILDDNKMYTFGQKNSLRGEGLQGVDICVHRIDSAMFLIDNKLCNDIRWRKDLYAADGYYIVDCYSRNKDNYIFVDNRLCRYNGIDNAAAY